MTFLYMHKGRLSYSSIPFAISALEGDGWLAPYPFTLYPHERPGTHRTGGFGAGLERHEKISPPLGFNPWTIQPVASHYIDFDILAAILVNTVT